MDPQFFTRFNATRPKFNPRIAGGFVVEEVNKAPEYINNIVLSAQNDFPPGLKYLGMSFISPEEEYAKLIKYGVYDVSKSTVYGVKLRFEYNGEELEPQHIFLPFLEEGGMLTISGSVFSVSPVLIDKAYSVGIDSIFLYVNRSKFTFKQLTHNYLENDKRVSSFVVWSDMYNGRNSLNLRAHQLRNTAGMELLVVHYLLAREGVSGMFKKYFDMDVAIGSPEQINENTYPPDTWTLCTSIGVKPSKLKTSVYVKNNVVLAVKTADLDIITRSVIASLFYVVDYYPNRVKPEYADDAQLWYLLLALTIKPDIPQETLALAKLDDHFRSLKTFVDAQVKQSLEDSGVFVNDTWDILVDVVKTYPSRINIPTHQLSSMYGKRLVILRYLLAILRNNIFKLGFDLQALTNSRKPIDAMTITKLMRSRLKAVDILKVNRNVEVNAISNPTDNMVPAMTLPVKLQTSMASKTSSVITKFTPSLELNASIAEVGNLTSDAKDDFTGRSRLNPFLTIAEDGTVLQNPELAPIIERTQRDIKRD